MNLPKPGTEARSPTLQVDSLSSEPSGKLENTGVDPIPSQGNYLTQESNRQILYQLSYQGSP